VKHVLASLVLLAALPAAVSAQAPRVTLETSAGVIVLELAPDRAPATVANFLEYVKAGFYDGTVFHRVIDGFMIQGGGFTPDLVQKKTRPPIKNESENGLSNARGTIAMARTSDPHSATAQFFINTVDNANGLDHGKTAQVWGYAVFGKVVEGMDVVDKIAKTQTGSKSGMQDVPVTNVILLKATTS
jgi:cyclophilin family peptidyl-prolyl cis-trans isomerase